MASVNRMPNQLVLPLKHALQSKLSLRSPRALTVRNVSGGAGCEPGRDEDDDCCALGTTDSCAAGRRRYEYWYSILVLVLMTDGDYWRCGPRTGPNYC